MKMVICTAYGCYNRSDKGKGKGISFSPFLTQGINQKRSRMAIQNWDRMGSEELLI